MFFISDGVDGANLSIWLHPVNLKLPAGSIVILIKAAEEQLNSFPFCEAIAGVEHTYRITEKAAHVFGIEKDGVVVAELYCDGQWCQANGCKLDSAQLQKIGDCIEDHYA